jgi:hypothetical protein
MKRFDPSFSSAFTGWCFSFAMLWAALSQYEKIATSFMPSDVAAYLAGFSFVAIFVSHQLEKNRRIQTFKGFIGLQINSLLSILLFLSVYAFAVYFFFVPDMEERWILFPVALTTSIAVALWMARRRVRKLKAEEDFLQERMIPEGSDTLLVSPDAFFTLEEDFAERIETKWSRRWDNVKLGMLFVLVLLTPMAPIINRLISKVGGDTGFFMFMAPIGTLGFVCILYVILTSLYWLFFIIRLERKEKKRVLIDHKFIDKCDEEVRQFIEKEGDNWKTFPRDK